jgi:hypothetical protein
VLVQVKYKDGGGAQVFVLSRIDGMIDYGVSRAEELGWQERERLLLV